jgi:hypothetical protein
LAGFCGVSPGRIGESPLPLEEWLRVGWFVDHEGAEPSASPDGSVLLQLAVGAGDGAGCQPQLGGQVADRRQSATWLEPSDGDHDRQLGPELLEAGDRAGIVQSQDQAAGETVLVGEADAGALKHDRSLYQYKERSVVRNGPDVCLLW